jgi:hypothetical protein
MPFGKKKTKNKEELDSKATFLAKSANNYLDEGKRDKAIDNFLKAAEIYQEIAMEMSKRSAPAAWDLAVEHLVSAAKVFLDKEDLLSAAKVQRRVATIKLGLGEIEAAAEYYNIATKYAVKERKPASKFVLIVAGMYATLEYMLAEYEKAREFLKRVLDMFDTMPVKEFNFYDFLREFFRTQVTTAYSGFQLDPARLEKEGLNATEIEWLSFLDRVRVMFENATCNFHLSPPKNGTGYMEAEEITAILDVTFPVEEIAKRAGSGIEIKSILVEKSNDLTLVRDFPVPAKVPFGGSTNLELTYKSYYPGDNQIGPLTIDMHVGQLALKRKLDGIMFTVQATPADIVVTFEKVTEPIIDKPFTLRIDVTNESRGDATDLDVEVQIPPELPVQVVRGTLHKKFYSLAGGESTSWEILLRVTEEGRFVLLVQVQFKDKDGKEVPPVEKEVPLEIKM